MGCCDLCSSRQSGEENGKQNKTACGSSRQSGEENGEQTKAADDASPPLTANKSDDSSAPLMANKASSSNYKKSSGYPLMPPKQLNSNTYVEIAKVAFTGKSGKPISYTALRLKRGSFDFTLSAAGIEKLTDFLIEVRNLKNDSELILKSDFWKKNLNHIFIAELFF